MRPSTIAGAIAATMFLAAQAAADEQLAAYLAGTCNTCHHGSDKTTAIPALSGREAADLVEALRAYRAGTRQDAMMHAIATSLSDTEITDVAAFLARQEQAP